MILRSADDSIECKSRFAKIEPVIPFSYDNLVEALNKAIDEEAKDTGNKFITTDKEVMTQVAAYDYDVLIEEFQSLVGDLMNKSTSYGPKITTIVEKYLGKGKKVGDTTPDQAEFIFLINTEIKEDLN